MATFRVRFSIEEVKEIYQHIHNGVDVTAISIQDIFNSLNTIVRMEDLATRKIIVEAGVPADRFASTETEFDIDDQVFIIRVVFR